MRLGFSPAAVADLRQIGDYIARDNPTAARRFVKALRISARQLQADPLAFPDRSDLLEGLRMMPFRRYLLFYRLTSSEVRVERVLHGARSVSANLFDQYG